MLMQRKKLIETRLSTHTHDWAITFSLLVLGWCNRTTDVGLSLLPTLSPMLDSQ